MSDSLSFRKRKVSELRHKLESVPADLARWERASSDAQAPLAKHHTQIRRAGHVLRALADQVVVELVPLEASASPVLTECRRIERQILELHRIWDFFRSKLTQRQDDGLRDYLATADDFAWACYQPVQAHVSSAHVAADRVREPPLIFCNGGSSPFAMSRGYSYQAESVPGEAMSTSAFRAVLRALPISVIGVPWFQTEYLPDALVIGHEVGHNVEDDFHLTERLATLLADALEADAVPTDRRDAWSSWLGEVFADTWGVLAAGPAFVGSLMDFLALAPRSIVDERIDGPPWGAYPTSTLRIFYCLEVLTVCGFASEAKRLRQEWLATYPSHAMVAFAPQELATVARAWVQGRFPELGDRSLYEIVRFTRGQQRAAEQDARRLLRGGNPSAGDVRAMLAAARIAFAANPKLYREHNVPRRILSRCEHIRGAGVRRGGGAHRPSEADLVEVDRATGSALQQLIRQAHD